MATSCHYLIPGWDGISCLGDVRKQGLDHGGATLGPEGRNRESWAPLPLPTVSTRMPGPLHQPFPFGQQELTFTHLCSQSLCPMPSSEFSLPPRSTLWQLWLAPSATAVSPPLFSPCMNEKASIFAPRGAAGRNSKAAALQTISLYTRPRCKVSGAGEVLGRRPGGRGCSEDPHSLLFHHQGGVWWTLCPAPPEITLIPTSLVINL